MKAVRIFYIFYTGNKTLCYCARRGKTLLAYLDVQAGRLGGIASGISQHDQGARTMGGPLGRISRSRSEKQVMSYACCMPGAAVTMCFKILVTQKCASFEC